MPVHPGIDPSRMVTSHSSSLKKKKKREVEKKAREEKIDAGGNHIMAT